MILQKTIDDFFKNTTGPVPSVFLAEGYAAKTPITGEQIASLKLQDVGDVTGMVETATKDFLVWRQVPMPVRGRLIGIFGDVIRTHKTALAEIVTLEAGKILSEANGEVQEMIDIAEYAVGLSRQIGGTIFSSELNDHVLHERWHPKGVVGIISAFNFPVAVWMWNLALSVVCGNTNIWKPSEKTLVSAVASHALWDLAVAKFQQETGVQVPKGVSQLLLGEREVGAALVADTRVVLVSATGSSRMGEAVQAEVAKTLGRSALLELGGNNAVVFTPSAPLPLALESTLFGAMGTAGQRCTTTRRLFIHHSLFDTLWPHLEKAYRDLDIKLIGLPTEKKTLIGPLIDKQAFNTMQNALEQAKADGGLVTGGERVHQDRFTDGYYVRPALVKMTKQSSVMMEEVFAPILYVMPYNTIEEAVALNNAVTQGLSAAIFTRDISEAEYFLSHADTGIVNVNNGTSGAEIGGAFGGNKATGGGRESGSDSWKQYMTRSTNRLNTRPAALKLAQGVEFPLPLDRDAFIDKEILI